MRQHSGLGRGQVTCSQFASQLPDRLANIIGSRVGVRQSLLSMVGAAAESGFQTGLMGFCVWPNPDPRAGRVT